VTLDQALVMFVRGELVSPDSAIEIDADTPLIDRGILDSLGLLQLMLFIEQQSGVRVPDDEVTLENFRTIDSIGAMVRRLQRVKRGGPDPGYAEEA
jgi:clorobiocin biosynthesis protein CloN5